MSRSAVSVSLDLTAQAGYITLSHAPIESTFEYNDEILVDLDALGMVVGIEMLSLQSELPVGDLAQRFHIRSELTDAVKYLRPILDSHLSFSTSAGISAARSEHDLKPQCGSQDRTPEFS